MPVIKRYPNRKLYDTVAKTYVTLDQVTQMIQAGQEVQVLDHETGEDLTNLTLTQIILEQEKRSSSGFLPRALLTNLIRTGGDTLGQVRRSITVWPTSREASVEEQASDALDQGRQVLDALQELLRVDERVDDLLHLLNVPSQRDVQQLQARLDALNSRLEELLAEDRAAGAAADSAAVATGGDAQAAQDAGADGGTAKARRTARTKRT
jgi:polyhydroxyalkanoate synthesis repressor PhaR